MSNDSTKRVMAEVRELSVHNKQPGALFHAAPLETDIFEWHFTVRGPPDTPFEAGLYHGRILLPPEYPMKAPEIILLTPNGRFEVGTQICLSVTSHHNETWQPSWGIRTILTALIGFMPSKSEGLGALDYPAEDRRTLARKSLGFECPRCGVRPADQFASSNGTEAAPSAVDSRREAGSTATASAAPNPQTDDAGTTSITAKPSTEPVVENFEITNQSEPIVTVTDSSSNAEGDRSDISRASASAAHTALASPRPQSDSHGISRRMEGQEKELLYLAYAIGVAILAIIARRVVNVAL